METLGRQEERKRRTRAQLLAATTQVLLDKGCGAMTVGDVVKRADVARGTFYLYFKDKEEAAWAVLQENMHHLSQDIVDDPKLVDAARLAKWKGIFDHVGAHRDLFQQTIGASGSLTMLRRFQDYVAEQMAFSVERGDLIPKNNAPSDVVAVYLAGAFTHVMVDWLDHPRGRSSTQLAMTFFMLARHQFEADP